jgi:hypothetical protein
VAPYLSITSQQGEKRWKGPLSHNQPRLQLQIQLESRLQGGIRHPSLRLLSVLDTDPPGSYPKTPKLGDSSRHIQGGGWAAVPLNRSSQPNLSIFTGHGFPAVMCYPCGVDEFYSVQSPFPGPDQQPWFLSGLQGYDRFRAGMAFRR